jgi:hypothetical protein
MADHNEQHTLLIIITLLLLLAHIKLVLHGYFSKNASHDDGGSTLVV